jgi:hypothetical protein
MLPPPYAFQLRHFHAMSLAFCAIFAISLASFSLMFDYYAAFIIDDIAALTISRHFASDVFILPQAAAAMRAMPRWRVVAPRMPLIMPPRHYCRLRDYDAYAMPAIAAAITPAFRQR